MSFPSKVQQLVIDHYGSPLLVVAAPGTGKTRTIVARMIRLLKENPNREISFITFTRTSRRDTDRRLRAEVGSQALDEATFDFPRISTLHTYAKSIVHKYAGTAGRDPRFSVLIEGRGERDLVLSEAIQDLGLDIDVSILKRRLSHYRNTNAWPKDSLIPVNLLDSIFQRFSLLLKFYNTIDIDGLVPTAGEILSGGHAELPPIFLQVDEYQDLNPADQQLIALAISNKTSQIVAVGDDAQSIYGFRNARLEGIRALWESKDWQHIPFPDSHRLPPHIVRASHALISGRGYLGDQINVPVDNGIRVKTLQCTTSDIQIEITARLISDLLKRRMNSKGEPLTHRDLMVLCPTGNFVSKASNTLEQTYAVPTKQRDKSTIPDDYWRLLLLLRMLQYQDSLALRQWLDIIAIPNDQMQRLRNEALAAGVTLYDRCSKSHMPSVKQLFVHLTGLRASTEDPSLFYDRLLEFPNLLVDNSLFPEIGLIVDKGTGTLPSIASVIRLIHERFGLLDPEIDIPDDECVLVTTMHSAKGLEADFVFILWLNSDFMPAPDRDKEEERRVLYVAMTRAKQDVILLFHEKFDGRRRIGESAMSPFLAEIRAHLNLDRVTRSQLS